MGEARNNISVDTDRLLSLAKGLIASDTAGNSDQFDDFISHYRAWILDYRGMADDQPVWAERNQILLHLMVSASTLREALEVRNRFLEPVWGSGTQLGIREVDDGIELFFDEPFCGGHDSFISTAWILSITACQCEFLVGHKLESLTASLRHDPLLSPELAELFLPRPAIYQAPRSALHISNRDLESPVVVMSAQIPDFLAQLMRLSITGKAGQKFAESVTNYLWREYTRKDAKADMSSTAAGLGVSVATLRRRLHEEGKSFRQLRAEMLDRLAKNWLQETDDSIEHIAERLGYSDAYAFRRAFRRMNGQPPIMYRGASSNLRA